MPEAERRWAKAVRSLRATVSSSPSSKGWKVTISSRRPRNSGRKTWRSSRWRAALWTVLPACPPEKPRGTPVERASPPTLEVMMSTVLPKLARRPWESVRIPSSMICKSRFQTSGWAFSSSSNNNTLYGWRRTASVSCPPSSCPT